MEEIEVIKLEDDIEYVIVDEIKDKEIVYVYLANIDDETDFCIRKIIKEDGKDMLSGLDNEFEYNKALLMFTKKHNKD